MKDLFEHFWAGTEISFQAALEAAQQSADKKASFMGSDDDEDEPGSSLLSVHGNVGIIRVKGPLIAGNAGWMAYFGVTGYEDIRAGLIEAVNNYNVKAILLDVNSGGGSVSGVDDTAALISSIDKNIKPVYTFADGMMASAAYWLGSSGRKVFSTQTAIVGSIGVLTTHREYSKMYEKDGIKNTIVRAGKYKALANTVEPLTAVAKEEMQTQVNDIYDIFLARVAENRKVSVTAADTRMGQGREFLGKRALEAGLVDVIGTFEDALGFVQSSIKGVDSNKSLIHNAKKQEGPIKMPQKKATLSEQQLAAIQSGVTIEAALETLESATETVEKLAQSDESEQEEINETNDSQEEENQDTPEASAPSDNLTAFLRDELKSSQAALVNAQVELQTLKTQFEEMKASYDGLVAIAQTSVQKMHVALGGRDVAVTSSGAELLAEHSRISEEFKSKFKVGGVAATAPEGKEGKKGVTPFNPIFAAMVPAAKQGK